MKIEISRCIKLLSETVNQTWNSAASLSTCRGLRRTCAVFWWQRVDKSQRHCTANDDVQSAALLHRCEPKHIHTKTLACLQCGAVLIAFALLSRRRSLVKNYIHAFEFIKVRVVYKYCWRFSFWARCIILSSSHNVNGTKTQDHTRPYNTIG